MGATLALYRAPGLMLDQRTVSKTGHCYELPVFAFAGATDAKTFDWQAGIEGAL